MPYAVTAVETAGGAAIASIVRDTYRAARVWADVNAVTFRHAYGAFVAFVTDEEQRPFASKVFGECAQDDGTWIRESRIVNNSGGTE